MAVIKVPYTYREFPHFPLATFVDKHTHKPSSCMLLTALIFVIAMLIGILLYNVSNHGEGILGVIANILLVVNLIWLIFGIFIIPKLSDHFDWAGKIAKKQMEKRLGNQQH